MTANYYMRYLVVSSPLVAAASVSAVSRNLRAWLNIQNLDLPLGPSPRNSWPSGAPHLPQLTWQAGTATIVSSNPYTFTLSPGILSSYIPSMLLSSLQLLRRSPDEKCQRMLARGTGVHIWRRCKVTLQMNHSSLTAHTWRTARIRTWRTRTPRWRSGPCTSPPSWRRRTLSSCSPPPRLTLPLLWPSCTQVCCVLLCIPSWQISKLSIDMCVFRC